VVDRTLALEHHRALVGPRQVVRHDRIGTGLPHARARDRLELIVAAAHRELELDQRSTEAPRRADQVDELGSLHQPHHQPLVPARDLPGRVERAP
jgi:hypothetical protein